MPMQDPAPVTTPVTRKVPVPMSKRMSGNPATATSKAKGSAFTKPTGDDTPDEVEFDPTRPAAFDLAAFKAGATPTSATRTLQVTILPNEAAELRELYTERDRLATVMAEDAEGGTAPRRRMAEVTGRTKRARDVEARIAELEDLLEGTWLDVRLRALTPSEQDEIRKRKIPVGVGLAAAMFAVAATIRSTDGGEEFASMDADGWLELIDTIKSEQFLTLDQALQSLSFAQVTPDFYGQYSASRATRSTSAS